MEVYYAAIGTVLAIAGFVWKMTSDHRKQTDNKMAECRRECDEHRVVIYRRFDQYKEHLERTHVSKEVHDIKYDQLKSSIDEIKDDVKTLVKRAKIE